MTNQSLIWLFFLVAGPGCHLLLGEEFVLIDDRHPCQVLVPASESSGGQRGQGGDWQLPGVLPDADSWTSGQTGVGFDNGTTFPPHFNLDVAGQMRGINGSLYVRTTFHADETLLAKITRLRFFAKYDDGFAAYLNGELIASANAPLNNDGELAWDATATKSHQDADAVVFEEFELNSTAAGLLRQGENVLAIHAFNATAAGSDFLISPRLIGEDVFVPVWPELHTRLVTSAIRPTAIAHADDGAGRLYIVEQRGTIRVWDGGQLRDFLDIRSRVLSGGEQGLLGLAFPPGFPGFGKDHFYVYYTGRASDGGTVVSRFRLDDFPGVPVQPGNPATEEILLMVDQPFTNHNGGDMHFGGDGFLYLGLGDGGAGGDPGNRAQNPGELLGKMLRLDVEGAPDPGLPYAIPPSNPFAAVEGVRPEIWALGLRNPWRWSFDRATGDMYIGDVGQNAYEELDFEPAGGPGGANYGWRRKEALHNFNGGTRLEAGTEVEPIVEVSQTRGDRSITGGFVYRGTRFPRMDGTYIYADYVSGRIFGAQRDGEGNWHTAELLRTQFGISAFGESDQGELFFADYDDGAIYALLDGRDATYLQVLDSRLDPATGEFSFSFGGAIGETYRAEFTGDLVNWEQAGPRFTVTEDNAYRVTLTLSRAELNAGKDVIVRGKKILEN